MGRSVLSVSGIIGGCLIVLEAGGRVTNFYGDDHFIEGHHIIATNGYLHPLFLKLLAEVPPLDM